MLWRLAHHVVVVVVVVVNVRFATVTSPCPPTSPASRYTSLCIARSAQSEYLLEEAESLPYCPTLPFVYVFQTGVLQWAGASVCALEGRCSE
jgi:hypothetical protein